MRKRYLNIIFILLIILLILLISPRLLFYLKKIYNFFLPFLYAFLFAYILNALSEIIQKYKIKRKYSIIIILLLTLILFSYFIFELIPKLLNQITDLINNRKEIIDTTNNIINNILLKVKINYLIDIEEIIKKLEENIYLDFSNIYKYFKNLFYIPVLTIYFLIDYPKIKNLIKILIFKINKNYYPIIKKADKQIKKYFKNTIIIMFILMILSQIAFRIINLNNYILFGFIIGITDIIPIIGPYLGGIIVLLYTLTISIEKFIMTLITILIVQFIESNILTPIIQSKNMKIPAILIFLSFIISSKIFGILGMILSTPIISFILIIIDYNYNKITLIDNLNKELI